MDARTVARVAAVQAIFEKGSNPDGKSDAKFLSSTFDQKRVNKKIFENILGGFEKNFEAVDELIEKNLSEEWKFERLTEILKAILRAGIADMKYNDTPKNVVLSEYVSIADSFVEADEVRFVNALLDKI